MRRNLQCRILILAGVFAAPAPALAVTGRYLPDPPVNFPNPAPGSQITAYGTLRQFDQPVVDTTKNINAGQIKFDYVKSFEEANAPDTWKAGGVAIAGGFFMNNGVQVKPGFQLQWVQTVLATNHGANSWGLPAAGFTTEFPDAGPAHPGYPSQSLPGSVPAPNPAPTQAFQDFPNRDLGSAQNWLAELGLVCVSNTPDVTGFREVRVVNTFLYGFANNPAGALSIDDVVENAPQGWSGGTTGYLNTLNSFYDGQGPPPGNVASSKFLFSNNSNCFIPEPGAMWLLLVGAVWALRRRAA